MKLKHLIHHFAKYVLRSLQPSYLWVLINKFSDFRYHFIVMLNILHQDTPLWHNMLHMPHNLLKQEILIALCVQWELPQHQVPPRRSFPRDTHRHTWPHVHSSARGDSGHQGMKMRLSRPGQASFHNGTKQMILHHLLSEACGPLWVLNRARGAV